MDRSLNGSVEGSLYCSISRVYRSWKRGGGDLWTVQGRGDPGPFVEGFSAPQQASMV